MSWRPGRGRRRHGIARSRRSETMLMLRAVIASALFSQALGFASPLTKLVDGKLNVAFGGPASRPLVDAQVIAKGIERAEMARVKASSVSDGNGYEGEPKEWANQDSVAQAVSTLSQQGPFARFKQFIADSLAGDFDEAATASKIDGLVGSNKVMFFSFSTCPFCLRAKEVLNEVGVKYEVMELDQVEDGSAIRAMLGRRTGRTSQPSVWVGGSYVGGCNDGGLGGVVPLYESGELEKLLDQKGAFSFSQKLQRALGSK